MNVFDLVKDNIASRQVAEAYGLKVNRYGKACCPFHNDRSPSFKVDRRYYCFGCGEKGDAIDFVSKHFGLNGKDAAIKICEDFVLHYKDPPGKAKPKPMAPQKSDEQIFKEAEQHVFMVLRDYYHQLKNGKLNTRQRPWMKNGIHTIQKLCRKQTTSSISWIRSLMGMLMTELL